MLKIEEIKELINLIDSSSIDEFKFEQNGAKIQLKKNLGNTSEIPSNEQYAETAVKPAVPAGQVGKAEPEEEVKTEKNEGSSASENHYKITSPMVGTFYSSPSPEAGPYIKAGDRVKKESVVCIVEAMKLMNEIEAEINGEIVDILVENGELVEYGQALFLVKPE